MAADRAAADDPRGLLVDFGGVLTTNVFASFATFCEAEGLAPDTVRDRLRSDPQARGLLADLETGKRSEAEFESRFAAVLGVEPERLVDRLFGGMRPDETMVDAVRAARRAGLRTGLLSNSWGPERYDRETLAELFDIVVISADVGMRKPDPAIYALAADRMALDPHDIVFVDDLPGNLEPARALGMATVLHRRAEQTVAELEQRLGVVLSA
jgi:epoxide hydrolase-like predicted phosphatase